LLRTISVNFVNKRSKELKKIAATTEAAMTISVSRVACALEGQDTLDNSVLTSFKKTKGFAPEVNPRGFTFGKSGIAMMSKFYHKGKFFAKKKSPVRMSVG